MPQHAVPMQQNRSAATAKQCIRTALAVILQKYMQLSLGNTSAKCGCQVAEADVQKQQGSASARVQAGVRLQMVRTTSAVPAMQQKVVCNCEASAMPGLTCALLRMQDTQPGQPRMRRWSEAANHQQATVQAAVCHEAAFAVPCPLQPIQCNMLPLER